MPLTHFESRTSPLILRRNVIFPGERCHFHRKALKVSEGRVLPQGDRPMPFLIIRKPARAGERVRELPAGSSCSRRQEWKFQGRRSVRRDLPECPRGCRKRLSHDPPYLLRGRHGKGSLLGLCCGRSPATPRPTLRREACMENRFSPLPGKAVSSRPRTPDLMRDEMEATWRPEDRHSLYTMVKVSRGRDSQMR